MIHCMANEIRVAKWISSKSILCCGSKLNNFDQCLVVRLLLQYQFFSYSLNNLYANKGLGIRNRRLTVIMSPQSPAAPGKPKFTLHLPSLAGNIKRLRTSYLLIRLFCVLMVGVLIMTQFSRLQICWA